MSDENNTPVTVPWSRSPWSTERVRAEVQRLAGRAGIRLGPVVLQGTPGEGLILYHLPPGADPVAAADLEAGIRARFTG
jgi:hypothetical protein